MTYDTIGLAELGQRLGATKTLADDIVLDSILDRILVEKVFMDARARMKFENVFDGLLDS